MKELLLIEDDKHAAKMYTKKFQSADFNVTIAKDGASGIEQARFIKPDVIVLDIMLP